MFPFNIAHHKNTFVRFSACIIPITIIFYSERNRPGYNRHSDTPQIVCTVITKVKPKDLSAAGQRKAFQISGVQLGSKYPVGLPVHLHADLAS